VRGLDRLIIHNVLTKHFNLPLTAALIRLLDQGEIHGCVAWCHDLTWTSSHSRSQVHPGYPWDLLRTSRLDVTYVAVSQERRQELSGLFGWPEERFQVIYNGVDPDALLSLSTEGRQLVDRLGLIEAGLVLLLPVRVTQAKNIEYALQVVAALKEAGCRPVLVITGPPDPHDPQNIAYYQSLLQQRDSLGLRQEARFVYESGPLPGEPYFIPSSIVAELYRLSDLLFMPSRREGFGLPVLEAGLVGLPVACAPFPAAREVGDGDILIFDPEIEPPNDLAQRLLHFTEESPTIRLRLRVRQNLTWEAIFEHQIQPLLEKIDLR
jgi:glycosyltransferase involved in cell wall biosynthesis